MLISGVECDRRIYKLSDNTVKVKFITNFANCMLPSIYYYGMCGRILTAHALWQLACANYPFTFAI